MFYLCRFSDNWLVYDTSTQKSKPLSSEEVATITKMFGSLFSDNSKILSAVKVESIPPHKLVSLPVGNK